ncbi:hypothetical protein CSC05_5064 [Escherichia coli]|nr:hypothetical protein CSC05_5064 [Escherichia coli]
MTGAGRRPAAPRGAVNCSGQPELIVWIFIMALTFMGYEQYDIF